MCNSLLTHEGESLLTQRQMHFSAADIRSSANSASLQPNQAPRTDFLPISLPLHSLIQLSPLLALSRADFEVEVLGSVGGRQGII